jgi:hypothetical protein
LDIFDVLLEAEAKKQFQIKERSRYSTGSRAKYRDASLVFEEDLNEEYPWLNDAKFKDKYRLTCSSVWLIVALIENHPIFQSTKKKQAPVEH